MQQAEDLYNQVVNVLDEESKSSTSSLVSPSYPSPPIAWTGS
jgi:hypothetical protein